MKSEFDIPIAKLADSELSIAEQVVGYLKDSAALEFAEIAAIMKRDYQTVWTWYSRLNLKREGQA